MKRQNILYVEKELILRQSLAVNPLGKSGACSPGKFWNSDLKSPETSIFQFISASSKFSRRATKLHEKGHFAGEF